MKKISIGALTAIIIGVLVALGVFINNQNNQNNDVNQIIEPSQQEGPRFTNFFFERKRFEKSTQTTQETTPEDINLAENETANTLFKENGFVVIPSKESNPFALYKKTEGDSEETQLVTKDLIYLSYLSLFKKVGLETRYTSATDELTTFFATILEDDTTEIQLKEFAAAALLAKGEILETTISEETMRTAEKRTQDIIAEKPAGTEAFWLFLTSITYDANETSELQALIAYLNQNEEQKERFLAVSDFWTYFFSSEKKTSLRDILEDQPLEEDSFTFFSEKDIFESIFKNSTQPEIASRIEPKPYDTIALAGNEAALRVLGEEGDTRIFEKLNSTLESGSAEFEAQSDDFWTHSYHHSGLELLTTLSETETEAQNDKNLYTLIALQSLLLQNEAKETAEKTVIPFSEKLALEEDQTTYANLQIFSEQILNGLQSRKLLRTELQTDLELAISIAKELKGGNISIDILNDLYAIYAPQYGEDAIAQLGNSETYTTLGKAHTLITLNSQDQLIVRGFSFSNHTLNSSEALAEWKKKPTEEKEVVYPLWTQTFIGIEE